MERQLKNNGNGWKPGQSGNPAGRPKGTAIQSELRKKLGKDLDKIIDKLRQQALGGDVQAIRILLDKVQPSLKPIELPTPMAMPQGTLAQQAHAVVQAVADGDIAPGQAAQIITSLGGVAKIVETTELLARIEKLEEQHAKTGTKTVSTGASQRQPTARNRCGSSG